MPTTFDPQLFRPEAMDAETAAFLAEAEARRGSTPPPETWDIAHLRAEEEAGRGLRGGRPISALATDRTIPGPGGDIRLHILTPDTVRGVYLFIHGGGFVFGRAHYTDPVLERVARACQVAVVSVDYRLAPEDPYPAAPDDCEAATVWLVRQAQAEFGTERLVIGGGSAGACLAAVTLLRLRDRHGFTGFAGANLVNGIFDLSLTPSARLAGEDHPLHPGWHVAQYAPPDRQREPDVSPLYADLRAMPPALFTVGTRDPLLDDSLFMSARWLAAGNPADLAVYAGGVHGFLMAGQPAQLAEQARARAEAFITEAVAIGPSARRPAETAGAPHP